MHIHVLSYRTSHRVILGEHDRSSSNEAIQVMKVGQVSDAQQILNSSSPTRSVEF